MFQENEISLCFSDFTLIQISRIINLTCFNFETIFDAIADNSSCSEQGETIDTSMYFKANIYAISSDTHQLQFIKLHHFKLERFKSIYWVPWN